MGILGRPLPGRLMVVGALLSAFVTVGYVVDQALSDDVPKCERFATASKAREQAVQGHGPRTVVIGDSYSAGLGLDDPNRSWPSRLPGEVYVYGFSGSGFSQHASPCPDVSYAERAGRAVQGGAELVILQGGLNDVGQPTADVRSGVRRLLRVVGELPVVLVGPPAAPARSPGSVDVDRVLAQEAERAGVTYVPMLGLRLDYLKGKLHLTSEGHHDFGAAVAEAIAH